MARLHLLGVVAFLLLQVARCDNPLVPGEVAPIADIEYKPQAGSMPLNGRELVSEWSNTGLLSKRYCVDAGYDSAARTLLGAKPNRTAYAAAPRAFVPAATPATPSAAASRPEEHVAPTGATVSKATSAAQMAARQLGESAARTGRSAIRGISACTAYVESGSTIALTPTTPQTTVAPQVSTPVAPQVTTPVAPQVTTPVYEETYIYYYWTITWYYYSYYYTYVYAVQESTLTTTYVTTTTVISAYQSNSDDATSELSSISSAHFRSGFPTPADATTALASATSRDSPSQTGFSGNSGNSGDSSGSGPGVGVGIGGVGALGSVGGAGMVKSSLPTLTLWAFAMGAVAVGTGMLFL
ncbi:hypothetical protein VE03_06301 [Pseudogymnoascus sp. 23342-1-I1]|nr:hypothetical protein VE03_06301 [Pseudogymnoascus sp. 23342-1-I1]